VVFPEGKTTAGDASHEAGVNLESDRGTGRVEDCAIGGLGAIAIKLDHKLVGAIRSNGAVSQYWSLRLQSLC